MKNFKTYLCVNENSTYTLSLSSDIKISAMVYIELNGKKVNALDSAKVGKIEHNFDKFGEYNCHKFTKDYNGIELITNFKDYGEKIFVSLEIINKSKDSVFLGKCGLMDACGGTNELGNIGDLRLLCRDGWGIKNAVVNPKEDEIYPPRQFGEADENNPTRFRTMITGDVYNKATNVCISTSFLTFDRADCVIYYSLNEENLDIEALCDFSNFELHSGDVQCSEVFRISSADSYHKCMNDWVDDVKKHYNPQFRKQAALGVLGETWCSGLTNEYAEQEMILRNAKAVSERLKGFGVEYFWVSIANLKDRVPGNWLECEYKQIPSGVDGLATDLAHFDMKLGLWVAPFWIPDKFSNQAEEQKNQLLKKDGVPIKSNVFWCRGLSGKYPPEERLNFFSRDGSSKDAEDYIRKVFTEYRNAGVRYYMIDFLWCSSGKYYGPFAYNEYEDKTKIAGAEAYRNLLEVIRETAGEDTYIVSSTGPTFINTGLVDGSRTGPDIGEGRAAVPDYSNYPGTYNLHNIEMLKTTCMNFAAVYHLNGKTYHCDSFNVVTIDKPIPLSEAQITISLAALFESPMMIGDPVFNLSEDRLRILKKALPQNKVEETAIPVDLFDTKVGDCPRIYHLPIERRWGKYGVVGLLNIEGKTQKYSLNLKELGYDSDCVLYDFWNERFLGIENGECEFEVAPYSIRVIRVTPYENKPQIIGTDMHVLQGAVEIVHTDFDEDVLTVALKRPIGESGVITILAPDDYMPERYEGLHVSKVVDTNLCVITKEVKFDIPTVTSVIPFKKTSNKSGDGTNDII